MTGEPLSGATVVVRTEEGRSYAALAAGDGRFHVSDLAPGVYRLTAFYGAETAATGRLELEPGEEKHVRLRLDAAPLEVAPWTTGIFADLPLPEPKRYDPFLIQSHQ